MDEMIELAEQLGEKLAAQGVTQRFVALQKSLSADTEAQKLMTEFQQQAGRMAQLESRGDPVEPADKHKLDELQSTLSGNATVKEFLAAQMAYMDIMRKINQAIMKHLGSAAPDK